MAIPQKNGITSTVIATKRIMNAIIVPSAMCFLMKLIFLAAIERTIFLVMLPQLKVLKST